MLDLRQSKSDLAELIKRRLGEPVIKVELSSQQIFDAIDYARTKWVKWGAGNSLVETYFTTLLVAGQNFYDMPVGVVDVVDYDDKGYGYGINTLFTIENWLYSRGLYSGIFWGGGYGQYGNTVLSYHLAIDALKTLQRYTPSEYNYKYHKYTNQIEIHPAPPSGNEPISVQENGTTVEVDSPGYLLIRAYMLEGSHYADMETDNTQASWKRRGLHSGDSDEQYYTSDWIFDYALAECKIVLGRIRSKFAQFNSIGNIGIGLDGDTLLQEGTAEKERLDETLRLEETHEGYGILIG